MPGVYPVGEYDLAGFVVGAVDRAFLLPRKRDIVDGDLLIGLASSGVHSNGFSLVRHIVHQLNLSFDSVAPFSTTQTLGIESHQIISFLFRPEHSKYIPGKGCVS